MCCEPGRLAVQRRSRMSFDTLAPHYRWMERLLAGEKLQRCRVAWLDEVRGARRALLVGEGHGRLLAECARRFPQTHFTCVDASSGMLEQSQAVWRKAGGDAGQIEFIHASLPEWAPPPETFDLIVTNFFLDCFSAAQLTEVVTKLSASAQPGARWLVADFQIPDSGWQRLRARLILLSAYTFFRVATKLPARQLTSPDDLLRGAGFELQARRVTEWGLLHTDLWEKFPISDCQLPI